MRSRSRPGREGLHEVEAEQPKERLGVERLIPQGQPQRTARVGEATLGSMQFAEIAVVGGPVGLQRAGFSRAGRTGWLVLFQESAAGGQGPCRGNVP